MNKNAIIGIVVVILIVIIGLGGYFLLKRNVKMDALTETKEPEEQVKVGNDEIGTIQNGKKSLLVYFSVPETDNANKQMTTEEENSAIVVDEKVLRNTQYVAMLISENTGGDLYRIELKMLYQTNHTDLVALVKEEQNKNVRPEIKIKISNFDDYDIIYAGYPIWWSDMPNSIYIL